MGRRVLGLGVCSPWRRDWGCMGMLFRGIGIGGVRVGKGWLQLRWFVGRWAVVLLGVVVLPLRSRFGVGSGRRSCEGVGGGCSPGRW